MPSVLSADKVPGQLGSTWLEREPAVHYPVLTGELEADVLVIGAGLAGALTAAELSKRGMRVAVVERRRVAGGTTGHSTAKSTVLHATRWSSIIDNRGIGDALIEWAALNAEAPARIGDMVYEREIECGCRVTDAYLTEARHSNDGLLAREALALRALGIPAEKARVISGSPFGEVLALRVPRQAQFDPAAFTRGLLMTLPEECASVFETTPVRQLSREGNVWLATLDAGSVRAPNVVMASLAPAHDPALLFTRMFPYSEHAMEMQAPASPVADGMWMQADGAHLTARPSDGPEGTWIVGGEHLRLASDPDERAVYTRFIRSAVEYMGTADVVRHWLAEDFSTPDGLPYIGRVGRSEGLYLIGGFGGWGISKSAVAARLIADEIEGTGSEALRRLLSPNRFPSVATLPEYLRENLYTMRRLVFPSPEQRNPPAISAPVSAGTAFSEPPRCTHLKCRTVINTVEGTLDCPCHGSRFTADGAVLTGPARRDIENLREP